jgi:hypothetical protein
LQESQSSFLSTPYAFAVFFVALWCLISLIVSFVGGWHKLSLRFRAQSEPYGDTRTAGPFFYGVQMKYRLGYNNVIRITAAEDALYLSILFLFRVGHPPLRVPWNEIRIGRDKFLGRPYIVLTLGNEDKIPMRISERMARKLGILERLPN